MRGVNEARQAAVDPAFGEAKLPLAPPDIQRLRLDIQPDIAGRVPELVAEVAVAFNAARVKADVPALGRECGEGKAQGVGAVGRDAVREMPARGGLDPGRELRLHEAAGQFFQQGVSPDTVQQIDGVQHIALGLGHLLSGRIADQARDIHLAERDLAGKFQPQHDHPRDPEKDDIKARHEHAGGVVFIQFRRLVRPAQGRERPQRGREPGVQHILVLPERRVAQRMFLADFGLIPAHINIALGVIPGRDTMTPPKLPADAPVLNVAQPFKIGFGPVFGHEFNLAVPHGLDGGFGQRLNTDIPLIGQIGLDHGLGAIAARDHEPVILDPCHQAQRLEVGHDPPARGIAIQAAILRGGMIVDGGLGREDIDLCQPVALAHFIVVKIMGRGDLDTAAAELRLDILIGDHGDVSFTQGQARLPPHQIAITLILWMHGDRGVAQHRLRPGGGHDDMVEAGHRFRQWITQMPEVAAFLLGDDLKIGDRRMQSRVPVDEALASIDQALLIKAHEDLADRGG